MRPLAGRQRAVLAIFIVSTIATMGGALASPENAGNPSVTLDVSPGDGNNLPSPAPISVTGAGFGTGAVSGDLVECAVVAGVLTCSQPIGRFTADSSGNFMTVATVTSTFTDAELPNRPVSCAATPCTIQAVSDDGRFFSSHHLSFRATTTSTSTSTTSTSSSTSSTSTSTTSTSTSTTSTTVGTSTSTSTSSTTTSAPSTTTTVPNASRCAQLRADRAEANAQIDAMEAQVNQQQSGSQRETSLSQLEITRAHANLQVDQALASSQCAPSA